MRQKKSNRNWHKTVRSTTTLMQFLILPLQKLCNWENELTRKIMIYTATTCIHIIKCRLPIELVLITQLNCQALQTAINESWVVNGIIELLKRTKNKKSSRTSGFGMSSISSQKAVFTITTWTATIKVPSSSIPWPASKPTSDFEQAVNSRHGIWKPVHSSDLTDSAALEQLILLFRICFC